MGPARENRLITSEPLLAQWPSRTLYSSSFASLVAHRPSGVALVVHFLESHVKMKRARKPREGAGGRNDCPRHWSCTSRGSSFGKRRRCCHRPRSLSGPCSDRRSVRRNWSCRACNSGSSCTCRRSMPCHLCRPCRTFRNCSHRCRDRRRRCRTVSHPTDRLRHPAQPEVSRDGGEAQERSRGAKLPATKEGQQRTHVSSWVAVRDPWMDPSSESFRHKSLKRDAGRLLDSLTKSGNKLFDGPCIPPCYRQFARALAETHHEMQLLPGTTKSYTLDTTFVVAR